MLQIKNTLGGGKPEGLYVWKKNNREITTTNEEKITKLAADTTLGAYGGTVYYSTSYTYDESTGKYTLTNPNSFTPTYTGGSSLANGNYVMYNTISSDVMYQTSTYSGSTSSYMTYIGGDGKGNVYIGSASGYGYPTKKYERVIKEVITDSFLGYIVSDKENAFPDGGEKGGYWYEKVSEGITPEMFGCTKCETGTFTVSSNTYTSPEMSHSLGVIPRFAIVWRTTPAANADKSFIYSVAYAIAQNSGGGKYGFGEIYASGAVNYSNGYNGNTSTSYFTSTKVIFNASPYSSNSYTYFKSGETYNYVLLG